MYCCAAHETNFFITFLNSVYLCIVHVYAVLLYGITINE